MKKLVILLLILGSLSCAKEFSATEDHLAPEIEILAPHSFEMTAGDTMQIRVKIEDNDQLHDMYLGLNNLSAMKKEIHWSQHFHGQSYTLDTVFIFPDKLPYSHWQLQIEASDHLGNARKIRREIFVLGNG